MEHASRLQLVHFLFGIAKADGFVTDDEVHRVVTWLKEKNGESNYIDSILEPQTEMDSGSGEASASGEADPLYDQAVAIILENKRASISLVQRHLRIGYNRAARLLESMEQAGLVSAMQSNGNREILARAEAGQDEE